MVEIELRVTYGNIVYSQKVRSETINATIVPQAVLFRELDELVAQVKESFIRKNKDQE